MYSLVIKVLTVSVLLGGHTVLAHTERERSASNALHRRQQFRPDTDSGSGADCAAAFGQGYITCRAPTSTQREECYNPGEGEKCCSNQWACPADSFCLVDGYCCPDGEDPATCAAGFSISLPADFSTASAAAPSGSAAVTPPSSSAAAPVTHSTSSATSSLVQVVPTGNATTHGPGTYSPTSSGVAVFTGAANSHTGFGAAVVVGGLLGLAGNMI